MTIRTYLDTGVLIAATRGDDAVHAAALAVLNEDREFIASDLLRLELLPGPTYHHRAEELAFYETFLASCAMIVSTTAGAVSHATDLACTHCLGSMDAMHLASAIIVGAQEFVTTEKPTKPLLQANGYGPEVKSLYAAAQP